jgi:tRNA pseudouridine55 synthase
MASGLVNLNKPGGTTSRQAINYVGRLVRPAKVGHAGTLDPLATGVLIVGVGSATRLIQYVQRFPKSYRGTFLLGRQSPTEDVTGEVVELERPPMPSLAELQKAAAGLVGTIRQRPPAYSALKVQGRRAYDLARRGLEPELQPREINVYRLEIVRYEYPELVLSLDCSSGTYVRSLGRDLAEAVGTAAVMSALVRTAIGSFRLEDAASLEQLTPANVAQILLSPLRALDGLPRVELSVAEVTLIRNGGYVRRPSGGEYTEWAGVDSQGKPVAVLVCRGDDLLGPSCNLVD